ncbi:hypothetical protein BAU08_09365 [Bordetella bronchialis]|uniref:Uncharacterized protein n=2 Tax=Bordetella bronchialis TaxID=463025 RepID=A0A193FV52_9BORD|nr:hypothetical protein BAU08_09365 [Bordetella bronchialis]
MRGEIFLLDRELQRENRRAREFADALRSLAAAVWQVRESRIEADGLDGLPADLFDLGHQAQKVAAVMAEPRNEDRVSALYRRLDGRAAAALGDGHA